MKRIWIGSLIVVCLSILSMILDYFGIRIWSVRPSHIVIASEVFIILFYPKDQMFWFEMKFLSPLPNEDLLLGGEKFQSYVLIEEAKFSQMFYSLSYDLDSLCFARYKYFDAGEWSCRPWESQFRERVMKFNEENPTCLPGNTTFFLIRNGNQYFVCIVKLKKTPLRSVTLDSYNLFDSCTRDAGCHLVIPKYFIS